MSRPVLAVIGVGLVAFGLYAHLVGADYAIADAGYKAGDVLDAIERKLAGIPHARASPPDHALICIQPGPSLHYSRPDLEPIQLDFIARKVNEAAAMTANPKGQLAAAMRDGRFVVITTPMFYDGRDDPVTWVGYTDPKDQTCGDGEIARESAMPTGFYHGW